MDTCDNGHPSIAYLAAGFMSRNYGRGCPLCEANEKISDLEAEIEALELAAEDS